MPQSYSETVTVTLPQHFSGQLFITPETDLYQQLDETTLAANVNPDDPNEFRSDNFKAAPIIVLPQPPPDLVVTVIKVPATVAGGDDIPGDLDRDEPGQRHHRGFAMVRRRLPVQLADIQPVGHLRCSADQPRVLRSYGRPRAGQSYTAQQSILLSPAYSGDYIIIYANQFGPGGHTGGTWEGPYGNNNTASVLSDVFTAPADLQVTSVVTQPQALFPGKIPR